MAGLRMLSEEVEHGTENVDTSGVTEAHAAGGHSTTVLEITALLFIIIFIGQLFKSLAARVSLPYTTLITVLGLIIGYFHQDMGELDEPIVAWTSMNPHLIMLIFLPPLIFESAFNTDVHLFYYEIWKILALAGPAVIASTYLTAVVMYYILGYNHHGFTFNAALMLGAILSATDPVAVVALLKELGASKRLSTLIEGESLMNDGTAMVVFLVLFDLVEGKELHVGEVIGRFCQLALGGFAFGTACGIFTAFILQRLPNNPNMEVNTTVFMTYLVFYTAEDVCEVSGILAIVAMGLWMSSVGKTAISPHSMHSIHSVWAYLGFIAETLIFFLAGLIVGQRYHDDTFKVIFPEAADFGKIVACYIFCNIIRFSLLVLLWPCLSRVGFKMDFAQVVMCSYSGLRGAVGLTLALIVANSTTIGTYTREVVLYYTAGIALLTLIINATTVGMLVRYLGLSDQTDFEKNVIANAIETINQDIDEHIDHLKHQRHFKSVDWDKIRDNVDVKALKEQMKKFKRLKVQKEENLITDPATITESSANLMIPADNQPAFKSQQTVGLGGPRPRIDAAQLKNELRKKYLYLMKGAYNKLLAEGKIMELVSVFNIDSIDAQLDDETKPLRDFEWLIYDNGLEWNIKNDIKYLEAPCIGSAIKYDLYACYAWAYDTLVNFIEAHEECDEKIKSLVEPDNAYIALEIVEESKKQIKLAQAYMHKELENFVPEIIQAVQERRATYYLLNHENHKVDEMVTNAELEERDAAKLKAEIDQKIYDLTVKYTPEVHFEGMHELILHSCLKNIFTQEEIEEALKKESLEETTYNQNDKLVGYKEKSVLAKRVIFVARGCLIEKDQQMEDDDAVDYSRGEFTLLQNLLPHRLSDDDSLDFEPDNLTCDLKVLDASASNIIALKLTSLKKILATDPNKLQKFWSEEMARRIVTLHAKNLQGLENLTQDNIGHLCDICKISLYKKNVSVTAKNGGIVLFGSFGGESDSNFGPVQIISTNTGGLKAIDNNYSVLMHFLPDIAEILSKGSITNEEFVEILHKKQGANLRARKTKAMSANIKVSGVGASESDSALQESDIENVSTVQKKEPNLLRIEDSNNAPSEEIGKDHKLSKRNEAGGTGSAEDK